VKKFSKIVTLATLIILMSVATFNYIMDPLWNFSHENKFNKYQMGFDERQLKTNYINFREFNYNALMIGSSRVTFIDRHDLKDYKAFNYSISNLRPYEYNDYTEYAKEKNKKDFDVIFLGIDMLSPEPDVEKKRFFKTYKANTESFLYRYKTLFSLDTAKYSFKNLVNSSFEKYKKRVQTYDRDMIVHSYKKSKNIVNKHLANILKPVKKIYQDDYKSIIQAYKKNNPNTKFYVFTTPLPANRLKSILSVKANQEYYTRWLKETREVFGEVYNFTTINNVTKNYTNLYTDLSHFYPFVGTHIVNKVFNYKDDDKFYSDFGIKLNKDNIDEEIKRIISTSQQ